MWTDAQLASAVAASTNWVGVMRMLGFGERSSSAGAIRIVRRRVAELVKRSASASAWTPRT